MNRRTRKTSKQEKGITLIALIVTIIVLLILAGVTINLAVNNQGIFNKAKTATRAYKNATEDERTGLDEADKEIAKYMPGGSETTGNVPLGKDTPQVATLPSKTGTKPFYPKEDGTWSVVDGTTLDNGLVITDHKTNGVSDGNEYVWIEVPSTYVDSDARGGPDYSSVSGLTDYDNIELALKAYTSIYRDGTNSLDEWYDFCGTTYDGIHNYSEIKYAEVSGGSGNKTCFEIAQEYYGKLYTDTTLTTEATSYSRGTAYYADISIKLNDTEGCGLSYSNYNLLKQKMLKSIYENGGFWVGRYETGISQSDTNGFRNFGSNSIKQETPQTPVIQAEAYPYLYVRCSQAQNLANGVNSGDYTSSLMFGVQWDLILKYLENKVSVSVEEMTRTTGSKNWGNYNDTANVILNKGKYTQYMNSKYEDTFGTWKQYNEDLIGENNNFEYIKGGVLNNASMPQGILLTTGASDSFEKMNIYDLAGNVAEFTLEHRAGESSPSCCRGGYFCITGNQAAAFAHGGKNAWESDYMTGFRVSIY